MKFLAPILLRQRCNQLSDIRKTFQNVVANLFCLFPNKVIFPLFDCVKSGLKFLFLFEEINKAGLGRWFCFGWCCHIGDVATG
jgi:hypothetical protein